jgi:hypothetical protein
MTSSASTAPDQVIGHRQRLATGSLIFIILLLIQFGLGMGINLFVGITRNHPGAEAHEFFSGTYRSVSWALAHGPVALAVHAGLGLVLVLGSIGQLVQALRWGTTGMRWATAIGMVFILAAGFNGGSFLNYNEDVNSLLMAMFFGAAVLCYAVNLYLLTKLRLPISNDS